MTRFRLRSAALSHVGRVRTVNEDALLARDAAALFVVADGMGGHAHGQAASRAVVSAYEDVALSGDLDDRTRTLANALYAANGAIVAAARAAGDKRGTTAVVLHLFELDLVCLWVGDSRMYRLRGSTLTQLTRDHSVVQELVDRGSLTPAEAETHPMSHMLSRAVGTDDTPRLEAIRDRVAAGDVYLVCSDGLTKVVPEPAIAALAGAGGVGSAADRLVQATLERGAPDNVSVILVSVEETTAVPNGGGTQ